MLRIISLVSRSVMGVMRKQTSLNLHVNAAQPKADQRAEERSWVTPMTSSTPLVMGCTNTPSIASALPSCASRFWIPVNTLADEPSS